MWVQSPLPREVGIEKHLFWALKVSGCLALLWEWYAYIFEGILLLLALFGASSITQLFWVGETKIVIVAHCKVQLFCPFRALFWYVFKIDWAPSCSTTLWFPCWEIRVHSDWILKLYSNAVSTHFAIVFPSFTNMYLHSLVTNMWFSCSLLSLYCPQCFGVNQHLSWYCEQTLLNPATYVIHGEPNLHYQKGSW